MTDALRKDDLFFHHPRLHSVYYTQNSLSSRHTCFIKEEFTHWSTTDAFFSQTLAEPRSRAFATIVAEDERQGTRGIEMIASEKITSKAVLEAQGSVLTKQIRWGYPNRRYYGGLWKRVERKQKQLAIDRAKHFQTGEFATRATSLWRPSKWRSNAALLSQATLFLGCLLDSGGHLTSRWQPQRIQVNGLMAIHTRVHLTNIMWLITMHRSTGMECKPKWIHRSGSAILWVKTQAVSVKMLTKLAPILFCWSSASLLARWLVATGASSISRFPATPHVVKPQHTKHFVPRAAAWFFPTDLVLVRKINSAVFPRHQGGPLSTSIAGKGVGLWWSLNWVSKCTSIQ